MLDNRGKCDISAVFIHKYLLLALKISEFYVSFFILTFKYNAQDYILMNNIDSCCKERNLR